MFELLVLAFAIGVALAVVALLCWVFVIPFQLLALVFKGLAVLLVLPFLVVLLLEGRHKTALLIFLAAAITDIVDGFLARRFGMTSPLGAYLDPIADKLFLLSSFIVFTLPTTPTERSV